MCVPRAYWHTNNLEGVRSGKTRLVNRPVSAVLCEQMSITQPRVTRDTVVLIGSESLIWSVLTQALVAIDRVQVIGSFAEQGEGIDFAAGAAPAVVIVEAAQRASQLETLTILDELVTRCPSSAPIVVAPSVDSWDFVDLVSRGVRGFLVWRDLDLPTIRHSLNAVLDGQLIVATGSLREYLLGAHTVTSQDSSRLPVPGLTERERAVLRGLANGMTQRELAAATRLSVRTVRRTITELEHKLNAPSTFALGVRARALGLFPASE